MEGIFYLFYTYNTPLPITEDESFRRDEVMSDTQCLERCNRRLNVGMDMAHMSFGSIDVPSVVERRDLELFCLLDRQHSRCVDDCGYTVQFNLKGIRMASHLACYARAAPVLSRHCRPRCGEYTPLQHTPLGYAQRLVSLDDKMIRFNSGLTRSTGAEQGRKRPFMISSSLIPRQVLFLDLATFLNQRPLLP
ncbi:hypothetical protein COOONC_13798 [Cooperia oncophora]